MLFYCGIIFQSYVPQFFFILSFIKIEYELIVGFIVYHRKIDDNSITYRFRKKVVAGQGKCMAGESIKIEGVTGRS